MEKIMIPKKLELYRKLLAQRDRQHFIIRFYGKANRDELVEKEMEVMQEYYNKVVNVPSSYTIARLNELLT
jgi:hypothetical protein